MQIHERALMGVILLIALIMGGIFIMDNVGSKPAVVTASTFTECAASGQPVMESYPRQCRSKEGALFVEIIATSTLPTTPPTEPAPTKPTSATVSAKLNQSASALGLKILPLELLEDSRCPVDVQCIQAGTVRIRANVTSAGNETSMMLQLGKSVTTKTEEIMLIDVQPTKLSTQTTPANQYMFIFSIQKR